MNPSPRQSGSANAALVLSPAAERVRTEYRDMPGLSLTERQAQRLLGLEPATCQAVLEALLTAGFLRQTDHGRYVRAGAGGETPSRS